MRPLIEPEIVRTIQVVTVRGRPHVPAVGAFVREILAFPWVNASVTLSASARSYRINSPLGISVESARPPMLRHRRDRSGRGANRTEIPMFVRTLLCFRQLLAAPA